MLHIQWEIYKYCRRDIDGYSRWMVSYFPRLKGIKILRNWNPTTKEYDKASYNHVMMYSQKDKWHTSLKTSPRNNWYGKYVKKTLGKSNWNGRRPLGKPWSSLVAVVPLRGESGEVSFLLPGNWRVEFCNDRGRRYSVFGIAEADRWWCVLCMFHRLTFKQIQIGVWQWNSFIIEVEHS